MAAVVILLFILYGVAQLVVGYIGIQIELGTGWAIAAMVGALMFRFTLPITIGSFFGAMSLWHVHWVVAALFAAPGLAFSVPAVAATFLESFRSK